MKNHNIKINITKGRLGESYQIAKMTNTVRVTARIRTAGTFVDRDFRVGDYIQEESVMDIIGRKGVDVTITYNDK